MLFGGINWNINPVRPDRIDIPVYATKQHSIEILARFPYLFTKHADSPSYFVPPMKMNLIAANDILEIGGCQIEIFHQDHGNTSSLGFLFDGKFGYSTDVVGMDDDVFDRLANLSNTSSSIPTTSVE